MYDRTLTLFVPRPNIGVDRDRLEVKDGNNGIMVIVESEVHHHGAEDIV